MGELVRNLERARLRVDPELAGLHAEHVERAQETAFDRHLVRKYGGSNGGGLQCSGCKRIKPLGEHWCRSCGYMDGGGYLGVPAPTSHLERWR